MNNAVNQKEYLNFFSDIKQRIASARISAARSVNKELIQLYWEIGKIIVEQQKVSGWGKSVVEQLSSDLRREYDSATGYSSQNLWYMRQFYLEYEAHPNLQQLVGEIPWGHNILIMQKVKDYAQREFYLKNTAAMGWSRNVLLNQIKADAYARSVLENKTHNFPLVMPEHMAELADEAMKSSYNLEFLGISEPILEAELEKRLISELKNFILELGYGFCFIGNQYRITLEDKEYFLDLLFYHRFLKCLVAVELKVSAFTPEHAGKMDFYLNVLNAKEKAPDDNPAIGIILCAEKNNTEVEFSLQSKSNPIGVAEYKLYKELPEDLKGKLPEPGILADKIRSEISSS